MRADRPGRADGWRTMLESGASLALGRAVGTDAPGAAAAPFAGIAAAIASPHDPAQRITLSDALRAAGQGAAHAGFAEQRFGNLAPGQRADFLILDRDIELANPADLAAARIVELWIGGQRVRADEAGDTRRRTDTPDLIGPQD